MQGWWFGSYSQGCHGYLLAMAEVRSLKGVLSFKLQNDGSKYYYDRAPVTMRANFLTVTSISFLFQKGFHQQR